MNIGKATSKRTYVKYIMVLSLITLLITSCGSHNNTDIDQSSASATTNNDSSAETYSVKEESPDKANSKSNVRKINDDYDAFIITGEEYPLIATSNVDIEGTTYNYQSYFIYDRSKKLEYEISDYTDAEGNPARSITHCIYGKNGNLTKIYRYFATKDSQASKYIINTKNKTEKTYDDYGNLTELYFEDVNDVNNPLRFYFFFEYDTNGNCVKTTEYGGVPYKNPISVKTYSYDANNNCTQVQTVTKYGTRVDIPDSQTDPTDTGFGIEEVNLRDNEVVFATSYHETQENYKYLDECESLGYIQAGNEAVGNFTDDASWTALINMVNSYYDALEGNDIESVKKIYPDISDEDIGRLERKMKYLSEVKNIDIHAFKTSLIDQYYIAVQTSVIYKGYESEPVVGVDYFCAYVDEKTNAYFKNLDFDREPTLSDFVYRMQDENREISNLEAQSAEIFDFYTASEGLIGILNEIDGVANKYDNQYAYDYWGIGAEACEGELTDSIYDYINGTYHDFETDTYIDFTSPAEIFYNKGAEIYTLYIYGYEADGKNLIIYVTDDPTFENMDNAYNNYFVIEYNENTYDLKVQVGSGTWDTENSSISAVVPKG